MSRIETLHTMITSSDQIVVAHFSPGERSSSTPLRVLTLVASTMHSELTSTTQIMIPFTARPRRKVSLSVICRFSQMMFCGCVANAAVSRPVIVVDGVGAPAAPELLPRSPPACDGGGGDDDAAEAGVAVIDALRAVAVVGRASRNLWPVPRLMLA